MAVRSHSTVREGIADHCRSRAPESRLEAVARRTMAAGTANFGLIAILTRVVTDASVWVDAVVYAFAVLAVLAAIVWYRSRLFADGLGARLFGVFADLGTLTVLLTLPTVDAVMACVLFAIVGSFFVFYLPRLWVIAHVVAASAAAVGLAFAALIDGAGVVRVMLALDTVLAAVVGTTMTMHLAWVTMRRRADLAGTDPLTGIRNLRGLWRDAAPMLADSADSYGVVAVAVTDIDAFKAVNDAFGHEVGDVVLVDVAHRLAEHIGDAGFVARSGGEEFTVVVVGTIDDVRDAVGSIPTEFAGVDGVPTVTMSVGAVLADPPVTLSVRDTARNAQRQADRVMYEVKRAGGNSVGLGF